MALAAKHGLKVIEDVAQAQARGYAGDAPARSVMPAPTASFPARTSAPSETAGGAVTTDDAALAERLRVLRNYGSRVKYVNLERGFNSRLDELQAAFLRAKLPGSMSGTTRRRIIAARYDDRTGRYPEPRIANVPQWAEPVWHLFVVSARRAVRTGQGARECRDRVADPLSDPTASPGRLCDLKQGKGSYPLAEKG